MAPFLGARAGPFQHQLNRLFPDLPKQGDSGPWSLGGQDRDPDLSVLPVSQDRDESARDRHRVGRKEHRIGSGL